MQLTPFQIKVLAETKKIPKGKITTYARLAKKLGKPKASRAIGQALGKNPWPVYKPGKKIPCHRVISSDGKLGGFSGGLKRKVQLLEREGLKVKNGRVVDFMKFLV